MSVHAVAKSTTHTFSKQATKSITLVENLGVKDDCHFGLTVQHRSRLHIRPPPANLRQVHLIPLEVLTECGVEPAEIGENITTLGIDLLGLGTGTRLHFIAESEPNSESERQLLREESHAIVEIKGLRNPCPQIDKFRPGLKEKFIVRDTRDKREADRGSSGTIIARRAGVMATVESGGEVRSGMKIVLEKPEAFVPLCVV